MSFVTELKGERERELRKGMKWMYKLKGREQIYGSGSSIIRIIASINESVDRT